MPGGRISTSGGGNAAWTALKGAAAGDASGYLIHDSTLTASDPGVAACLGANSSLTLSDCQWRNMNTVRHGAAGRPLQLRPLELPAHPAAAVLVLLAGRPEAGDYARAFYEAMYVNRQSKQQLAPEPLIIGAGGVTDAGGNLVTISKDNYYNPFGKDFSNASMRLNAFGDRIHVEEIQSYRVVAGLDGTLPDVLRAARRLVVGRLLQLRPHLRHLHHRGQPPELAPRPGPRAQHGDRRTPGLRQPPG